MFDLDSTPQRPGKIWSRGVALGWLSFRRLFGLAALLGLISLLPTFYLSVKIGDAPVTPDTLLRLFRQGHFTADLLLLELAVLVLSSFVSALIIRRVDQAAAGAATTHELRFALSKLPTLVLSGILVGVTLVIGILIAAIVGAIVGVALDAVLGRGAAIAATRVCVVAAMLFIVINLLFFQFAIVLDGKGPVAALNHSCALVFRNWWRTFLVLLITCVVIAGIAMLALLPFAHWLTPLGTVDTGRTLLVKGVLRLVGAAVFSPFVAAILYVLYRDLKMRRAQTTSPTAAMQA